jgi:hypothetical protein
MAGMKRSDVLAAVHVAVFLFGAAWLDGAFEIPVPPKVVPQFDKPHMSQHLDHWHQEPVNLTVPQASMPIGNRFIYSQPQTYRSHFTPQDDNWWMGTPHALLFYMAARRMPVVYEPARDSSLHT